MAVCCGLARRSEPCSPVTLRPARMRVEPDRNSALAGEEGEGTAPAAACRLPPILSSDQIRPHCPASAPPRSALPPRSLGWAAVREPRLRWLFADRRSDRS